MKVIRVTAIWCMSCLVMRSRYDRIFKEYNIDKLIDLDYDEDSEKIENLDIGKVLPAVIIYKNDQEVKRINGEKSKKKLKKIFKNLTEEK